MAGKALTEKLDLKPGMTIFTVGGGDWLLGEIGEAIGEEGIFFVLDSAKDLEEAPFLGQADMVLFWAKGAQGLEATLKMMRERIGERGAIWVALAKKAWQEKEGLPRLAESDVFAAAKEAGLVDVKVASLSEKEYAIKLVIPRHLREG